MTADELAAFRMLHYRLRELRIMLGMRYATHEHGRKYLASIDHALQQAEATGRVNMAAKASAAPQPEHDTPAPPKPRARKPQRDPLL